VTQPLDLSAFRNPVVFPVEGIGPVVVEARKTGFHLWLGKGMERGRWPEGAGLMRDLLVEQGRLPDGAALEPVAVAKLSADGLEAAAGAFLEARDPVTGTLSGEAAGLGEGERQTDRLRRILFASAAASLAPARRVSEEMNRRVKETWKVLGPVQQMLEQQRRIDEMLRPATTLMATHKALFGGTASEMLRAAERAAQLTAIRSPLEDLIRPGSAIFEMQASVRRATEALGVAGVYPHLSALGLTAKLGVYDQLFGEASSVAKLLRSQFDLRLPRAAVASIGALHAAEASVASRIYEAVNLPGFQATVVAGLDGAAPRGGAADVLAHYGEEVEADAPVFATVMSGVTAFDDPDEASRADRLEAALARLAELVADVLRREQRPITFMGVMNIVGVLMGVIGVGLACMSYQGDEADRRAPGTAAVIAKLDELKAIQPPPQQPPRDTRYVHDRAWLRAAPDGLAPAIRAIYPDQPLRVLEATDAWAKVEAYDYASDRPLVGWISRRRLRVQPLD
jgi:hypothetical protein